MRSTVGAWAAFLLVVGSAGSSEAHTFEFPKTLRLGIERDRVLLSVTYDVNPGMESARVRSLFDRNGDGALDDLEQGKIARYLEETATLWLRIARDGREVRLDRVEVVPHHLSLPRDATDSLGVAIVLSAPLGPQDETSLRIDDRDKDSARRIPLLVDLSPEWVVAFSSQGELYPRSRQIQGVMLGQGRGLELRLRRSSRDPTGR